MSGPNRIPEYRRRILEKAEEDKRTAERKRKEAHDENHVKKLSVAIERIEQALDRNNYENSPQKQSDRLWEKLGIVGLWAAAFVGVFAVYIGNRDSNHLRKVMITQAATTRDQEERSLRAYIYVTAKKSTFETGKSPKFIIDAHVVGPTPAYSVIFQAAAGISNVNDFQCGRPIPPNEKNTLTREAIGSQNGSLPIAYDTDVKLPKLFYDGIRTGTDPRFFFWGAVSYVDIFHCRHWVKFCYRMGGPALDIDEYNVGNKDDPNPNSVDPFGVCDKAK